MKLLLPIMIFLGGAGLGFVFGRYGISPHGASPETQRVLELNVTDGGEYRVRKVVDGDTIVLENGVHVRYHAVSAPEMGRFVKDPAPFAQEATARNIALVEGQRVRLQLAREPLDIHGRVVARVLLVRENAEPQDVAELLIKEGLGRPMGLGVTAEQQRDAQQWEADAKEKKLGMWALEEGATALKDQKPFCAATGSNTFHASTCATAKRIKPMNLHFYDNAAAAEAAGLKPCSKCNPK